jgi:hypothetical protein
VGMQCLTLQRHSRDAERRRMHSHAERGNEKGPSVRSGQVSDIKKGP